MTVLLVRREFRTPGEPSPVAAMSPDERGQLRDICDHPDDDRPRLVYADWREETGEAARIGRAQWGIGAVATVRPRTAPRLARARKRGYSNSMIRIHFPDTESRRSALAQLAGRFSFKSWATGELLVPDEALSFLAVQGIAFTVEGPAAAGGGGATIPAVPNSLAALLAGVTSENLHGEWAADSPAGGNSCDTESD